MGARDQLEARPVGDLDLRHRREVQGEDVLLAVTAHTLGIQAPVPLILVHQPRPLAVNLRALGRVPGDDQGPHFARGAVVSVDVRRARDAHVNTLHETWTHDEFDSAGNFIGRLLLSKGRLPLDLGCRTNPSKAVSIPVRPLDGATRRSPRPGRRPAGIIGRDGRPGARSRREMRRAACERLRSRPGNAPRGVRAAPIPPGDAPWCVRAAPIPPGDAPWCVRAAPIPPWRGAGARASGSDPAGRGARSEERRVGTEWDWWRVGARGGGHGL